MLLHLLTYNNSYRKETLHFILLFVAGAVGLQNCYYEILKMAGYFIGLIKVVKPLTTLIAAIRKVF